MPLRLSLLLVSGLLLASPTLAQPVASPAPSTRPSNAEMAAIFAADQEVRRRVMQQGLTPALEKEMVEGDAKRRARTRELLDGGKLQSGDDYRSAAFLFQHGSTPADYLLAHTLAVIAAARGRADATWIAAATLDRYLQAIGQPQIYGTQYTSEPGKPITQEPYNRTLVSDQLRRDMGVAPLAKQEERRLKMQERLSPKP